jgi:uncharacterized protein YfaS (alpha-2-macroglobulin family)
LSSRSGSWILVGCSSLLLVIAFLPASASAQFDSAQRAARTGPLRILRITPGGEDVPGGRQIVFQFDRPVVPIGRMARRPNEIPISIAPDPGCDWRWIDPSALACQLGEENPLRSSTHYRIRVNRGIETAAGVGLERPVDHSFVTERPKVVYRWFETWTSPGMPVVRLTLNQPVLAESLARHLFFLPAGGRRVPADVREDEERHNTFVVQPRSELPLDTPVELRVEPGIRSAAGPEASADDQPVVTFATFPELRFLGVRCRANGGGKLHFAAGAAPAASEAQGRRCNPLDRVSLLFSAPVLTDEIAAHLRVDPDLAGGRSDFDPWENVGSYSQLHRAPERGTEYAVRLPRGLRAYERYQLRAGEGVIRDEFGRPLAEGIDLVFFTDHRPPRLHLSHPASVLESQIETHTPVVVTNLKEMHLRYDRMTANGVDAQQRDVPVAEAEDVAYRAPLAVREWLDAPSGAVVGGIASTPPTTERPQWFFSEVTPFHVHVKVGHYNSLVWVTDLATGRPVRGARVEIFAGDFESFESAPEVLSRAETSRKGIAELAGLETLDPENERLTRYWMPRDRVHLHVKVAKDGDIALVPLAPDFRVPARGPNDSWIPSDLRKKFGHLVAWGTTAQGIYRAGETVQFKFFVRNEGNDRLIPAPRSGYVLEVIDPMDKVVHRVEDVSLNDYGSYSGEFAAPKTGAVGWYRFRLEASFAEATLEPLRVLISDFTPSPFRVQTELFGELFREGEEVRVATRATLHSGGPYGEADTRVTARLRPTQFRPAAPQAQGFAFDTGSANRSETPHRSEALLDAQGALETRFLLPESKITYGTLEVESSVRDDRGKYVAGRSSARFAGRDRYVGIRQPDWVLESGKGAEVFAVVADEYGKLASGVEVAFKIERRITRASRVKGAGNAYITQFIHSWKEVAACELVSGAEPSACAFTPDGPGSYKLSATVHDTRGRESRSEVWRWATGKGAVLWEEPPGHRLQITPEKEVLRVGETARYLIKNPYPGAKALVTIERFGVQKSWVETLADSSQILEFEVEPDFLPGFYLSVVVTSPRVEQPTKDALEDGVVDLGKPAFRMGYVKVPVRDAYKELAIEVHPEREGYKPRETVAVDLRVRTRQGKRADAELAVAVLDEAVLDLIAGGRRTYDPYRGFYELKSLDLSNYNLLKRLVGIQKFEQKGANPGGGGGDLGMRSEFEFVAYWNPSVVPDAKGRARVTFRVPDNLTGWRVLVFGATPGDRMGLGDASFAVNQPTEIRPALPNQIIEGDRFTARFTVMNRTDSPRDLTLSLRAEGSVEGEPSSTTSLRAEPYKRHGVELPVQSGAVGEIRFQVRAGDDLDADGLRLALPVNRRSSFEVAASYGTTTADAVSERVRFPKDIREDVGTLDVVASPTVIGGVDGAFRYMRSYPYLCWEQRLSKGVMASHYTALRAYLPDDLDWPGSETLPAETLADAADFQAPNGGMVYWIPRDEYVSPYLSAYTALAFQWLRRQGHVVPTAVEERLHTYLLGLLRKNVFPTFYSRGMASSVRAVALAALAPSGAVTRDDLLRYRSHVEAMDLFGKAWYLRALGELDRSGGAAGTDAVQLEVLHAILAHASQSGGKYVFSETLDDGFARILHTPLRSNCSILSALAALAPQLAEAAADAPFKLVRTITQTRERRDHWENTQENLFCMNALVEFSRSYERDAPDFEVAVAVGDEPLGSARFRDLREPAREIERPIRAGDAGRETEVRISRRGQGRLHYATRLRYAPVALPSERANAGIDVRREYSVQRNGPDGPDGAWRLLADPVRIEQGDLVRVDLYVSLPAARNFVVVDDPIPGGLEPVNRDLATASTVDADAAVHEYPPDAYYFEYDDWRSYAWTRWSFYHRELRHEAARFFSDYLPAGRYHLSYVAQAIAPGEFTALPLRAEEMYDPDVYGRGLPATLVVDRAEAAAP